MTTKTDDEIFAELQAETRATAARGIEIDMTTTGLQVGDRLTWEPESAFCPRCVIGCHMAGRPIVLQGAYPTASWELAHDYERDYDWGEGMMDGTLPHSAVIWPDRPDYMAGYNLGRRLLDWVQAGMPVPGTTP